MYEKGELDGMVAACVPGGHCAHLVVAPGVLMNTFA